MPGIELDKLLADLAEKNGSDLHLKVGRPPLFRVAGFLTPSGYEEVTPQALQDAIFGIMAPSVRKKFEQNLEADFSYEVIGLARFRVNVFVQRGQIGTVFRLVPIEVPTIDSLGLPPVLKGLSDKPNGLILVTGPTGSGKSTTLACMMEHINNTRPVHIVTVEDPIEFVYTDQMATVNQRELGIDTRELHAALRAVLRQDPDVILIGEMRDKETMRFAITAAETGHLVFSTLHTNDAKQTLDRILDNFPDQTAQIRAQLALLLRGVISQRLLRRADGMGLVPAMEILINTAHVTELIEQGMTRDIEKAIAEGRHYQMQTFNQSLLDLVKTGVVTEEEALGNSSYPEELRLGFRGITKGSAAAGVDLDFGSIAGGAKTKGAGSVGSSLGGASSPPPAKPGAPSGDKDKPKVSRGFDF
jgi:twitching motility protein PilT